jgi:hypothetical protein
MEWPGDISVALNYYILILLDEALTIITRSNGQGLMTWHLPTIDLDHEGCFTSAYVYTWSIISDVASEIKNMHITLYCGLI